MEIKSALIERKDSSSQKLLTSSGILIQNRYVITTSNIFDDFLQKNSKLVEKLRANKIYINNEMNCSKLRVVWKHEDNSILFSKEANVFGTFKYKILEDLCKNELTDWSVDFKENNFSSKNLLSVLFILALENEAISEEDLKSVLHTWLVNVSSINLNKGDGILCRFCPFGTRDFLNSVSAGIISNTLKSSTFLLSDCSSTPGCEGGLVYFGGRSNLPIGIVISSLNWWRKEWAGFTLIADIRPILCQILGLEIKFNKVAQKLNKVLGTAENSLVQINCGTNWGTCILLSKEKGIFLTNSHVVNHENNISLFWKNKKMPASLIYKNPDDSVFDLAIIKCNKKLNYLEPCITSNTTYSAGDSVYCAGYPLLSSLTNPEGVTITHGVISSCNSYMIKTTCGIFPGFSGGAVLDTKGILLGIIVCNTRLNDIDVTYPKFNMAIPFQAISDIIAEYMEKKEYPILEKIKTADPEAVRMWMKLEGKL